MYDKRKASYYYYYTAAAAAAIATMVIFWLAATVFCCHHDLDRVLQIGYTSKKTFENCCNRIFYRCNALPGANKQHQSAKGKKNKKV